MSLFLSPAELETLTGKVRPSAQVRALTAMGIRYTRRPDGVVVVVRADIEAENKAAQKPKRKTKPDWSALDVAA
ncbi:DUF4224 domain-containing protein [Rhodocyclus purpureus]|uniref:DUF4224 domain-containing protein n=1 Tax=Rhodocyclus purpureus TaxID=1067 RepID=UPI0019140FCE|nr:DUF4224 domain-containing protein [Rhodocyclus purpureus]MBK5915119.1 hypothetical protein [Rhodocyclus purpureus]